MGRFRIVIVGSLLLALVVLSGCKKKKPPVPPPQAQAPTINVPAAEPAQPATEETQPTAQPAQPEQPATDENKPAPEVVKPQPKTHIAKRKPKKSGPTRIIVEDGGKDETNVPPPPLVADNSSDSAQRRNQTESLLNSAERDVAGIHRPLSSEEQAIVRHIHSYVDQSREALKEGDVDRAYNLALKAHLLSDSLKK